MRTSRCPTLHLLWFNVHHCDQRFLASFWVILVPFGLVVFSPLAFSPSGLGQTSQKKHPTKSPFTWGTYQPPGEVFHDGWWIAMWCKRFILCVNCFCCPRSFASIGGGSVGGGGGGSRGCSFWWSEHSISHRPHCIQCRHQQASCAIVPRIMEFGRCSAPLISSGGDQTHRMDLGSLAWPL